MHRKGKLAHAPVSIGVIRARDGGGCVGTGASWAAGIVVREAIVDILVEAGWANDSQSRLLLIDTVSDELNPRPTIPNHTVGRDHLLSLVNECAKIDDGLAALVRVIRMMRPGSRTYERLRPLVDEPRVLALLPDADLGRLRDWLADVTPPYLPALVRRAAGPGAAALPHGATAWDAFRHLADFNAGSDGFPPALSFVELLARRVDQPLQSNLTLWNEAQVRRLRLEGPLAGRRAAESTSIRIDDRVHLTIAVRPDGIDPDRCMLSHWRQDDPDDWPPPLVDEVRTVPRAELERHVDDIVVRSERALADFRGRLALEFVLPRELFDLPVHLWRKEHDSGDPRPLCLDYPITVRSLERMMKTEWHRVWRLRWESLMDEPSVKQVYFGQPADTDEPHRIDAILSDPKWVLMVLPEPPDPIAPPGADALSAALRSGLPALLWQREGGTSDGVRGIIERLAASDGLGDLPSGMQAVRREAIAAKGDQLAVNTTLGLVILWDDPHRLVAVGDSVR